ncbi:hypothetical protein [Alicyclobacillus shizuokensis]|uniref:hypothetical protein n=1 Tax=Alicyclobacillus shizuokensis TaxID=392014 RepID=UPI0008333B8D|nr:hypothetical protein [Alicyclobacillus shizuokensis]MCL6625360.1 hypothetical protein [Alicyclobacillus shizuokensis]
MLVWVRVPSDDRFLSHQGVPAHPDMKAQELLDKATQMWGLPEGKTYQLVRLHATGQQPVHLDKTLQENGLRDGDPIDLLG